MSTERTDAQLLEAWRAGEGSAANELLQRHFIAVYRFFAANVGTSGRGSDADDLAQRTFQACIERRDAVQTDFRSYLFGVARRQLYSEWARRRGASDVVSPSVAGVVDVQTSPSAAVARLDEQKLLLHVMQNLPIEYRAALELFFWEECSVVEIAQRLAVPVGTVKSRLHRGRALLRDNLLDSGASPDLRNLVVARLGSAD